MHRSSRRRLAATFAALALTGVGCGKSAPVPKPAAPKPDVAAAEPERTPLPTAADLRAALERPTDAEALAALEALLARGATHDLLREAVLSAHAALAAPALETEALAALWRVERSLPPSRRLEALLHGVARYRRALAAHGRAVAPAKPDVALRQLDESGLQDAIDRAIDAGDAVGVSAGLRVTLEEDGQEAIGNALVRVLVLDDGVGGARTAGAVAALRLLEARGYRDAAQLLDHLAAWTTPAPPAARARAKVLRQLAREVPEGFERGVHEPSVRDAVRSAATTGGGGEALVQRVRAALAEAVAPTSLWDGLALAAADRAEPDARTLRMVHALRLLGERSPSPAMRALCLLAAADRFPAAAAAAAPAGAAPAAPADAAAPAAATPTTAPDATPPTIDVDALRGRLVELDHGDGAALVATVARIEAAAMADPEVREKSAIRAALRAGLRMPGPHATPLRERAANLALIARLRAPPPPKGG